MLETELKKGRIRAEAMRTEGSSKVQDQGKVRLCHAKVTLPSVYTKAKKTLNRPQRPLMSGFKAAIKV